MDYTYDKFLGKRISILRQQNHLTQEELTAKLQLVGCDMTRSALAKIEVGQRHIYAYEIKAISQALSISFDDLLL